MGVQYVVSLIRRTCFKERFQFNKLSWKNFLHPTLKENFISNRICHNGARLMLIFTPIYYSYIPPVDNAYFTCFFFFFNFCSIFLVIDMWSQNTQCQPVWHMSNKENVTCTTSPQHGHNNPSNEGGPTLMWEVVVLMLWACSATIKSRIIMDVKISIIHRTISIKKRE
jgi:hypothetical protein